MSIKKVQYRHGDKTTTVEFDTSKPQAGVLAGFMPQGVPQMESVPDHPGEPKGTDTVPAWLTPGEYVVNAEATRMFEPQIEAMNDVGRAVQAAQGGSIPEYKACGGHTKKPVYREEGGVLGEGPPVSGPPPMGGLENFDLVEYVRDNPLEAAGQALMIHPAIRGAGFAGNLIRNAVVKGASKVPAGTGAKVANAVTRPLKSKNPKAGQQKRENGKFVKGKEPELQYNKGRVAAVAGGGTGAALLATDGIVDEMNTVNNNPTAKQEAGNINPEAAKKVAETQQTQDPEDPTLVDKARDWFVSSFKNIVDPDKLLEAGLIYAGSRALGHSHEGSLVFVGERYMDQVGGKLKAAQTAELSGKFDAETIAKFKDTGDYSLLKVAPGTIKTRGDVTRYMTPNGRSVRVQKVTFADGTEGYVDAGTNNVRTANEVAAMVPFGEYENVRKSVYDQVRNTVIDTLKLSNPKMTQEEALRNPAIEPISQAIAHFTASTDASFNKAPDIIPRLFKYVEEVKDEGGTLNRGAMTSVIMLEVARVNMEAPKELSLPDGSPVNMRKFSKAFGDLAKMDQTRFNSMLQSKINEYRGLGEQRMADYQAQATEGENGFIVFLRSQNS